MKCFHVIFKIKNYILQGSQLTNQKMFLEKYISFPVVFVSFIVGIICIFIFGPETKTIYMYPSIDQYDKILYKDKADKCFQMIPEPRECDYSAQTIPVQD